MTHFLRNKGGSVTVEGILSVDGRIRNAKVVRSSHAWLEQSAVTAFQTWRFRPATCDGEPIAVWVTMTATASL